MSWSMCIDVYVKKDGVWASTDIVDRDCDILKSLCEYRGSLNNDIVPLSLSNEDIESLTVLQQKLHNQEDEVSGYYYDASSFSDFRADRIRLFKELIVKNAHLESIQQSLDYLKLSAEEKQNVLDERSSLIEELESVECKIDALTNIIAILDIYSEYDSNAVAFIYSV